jgi:alginate O-acetyltransferase complex protein AlgI
MLFNSYPFFCFLLLALPIYYLLNPKSRYIYLLLCSAIFFGDSFDFFIFLLSVLCNAIGAFYLIKLRNKRIFLKLLFGTLVCINILYLAYFKYFYVGLIPLAISFYTFEQITYLSYIAFSKENENTTFSIKDYLLFIAFFPRLLAGPIYYYGEYKDKLQKSLTQAISWDDIGRGMSIFCLGLFKKVVCADRLAIIVDSFYRNPEEFSTVDTWFATLAYSLQIYFDFSAYSEMALGIGMMFGVILPLNFNSPYKATSIIDFWSRWHMTLSRFIKEYVYIPLGGNQKNQTRNIIFTMSLAGLWHGSGLNFLAWGSLHGILIGSNHLLRRYGLFLNFPDFLKILFTFILINTTWIFFRSSSFNESFQVLYQYIGFSSATGFHFGKRDVLIVMIFIGIIFTMPNINDLFFTDYSLKFKRSKLWGIFCLGLFIYAYKQMDQVAPFIYFNF